jgi:soluble lytic murein transglycosylase-like protein
MPCASVVVMIACSGGGDADTTGGRAPRTTLAPATTTTVPPPTTTTPPVTSPEQIAAPSDADQAVEVLTRVERGLRSDDRNAARLARLGWEQQKAYGTLLAHPDWQPQVLAQLPDDVRDVARANLDAGNALTAPDLGPPLQTLPDWTILVPKPVDVLVGYYREAERATGIPWHYLAAIHFVESKTGRIRGNSSAGAQGPMQFIPSTWAAYGEGDVYDDHDSIQAAARYLSAAGGPANMPKALYAYNPSDAYVTAIERYASVIAADPRALDGYHAWQVYVSTVDGTHYLPEGWTRPPR